MKRFLILFSFFLTSYSYAQHLVYFLKNNGQYVTRRDSADFIRVVSTPDSASVLYNVVEFYSGGKIKLRGKSSKVDQPIFEGTCLKFYKSGVRQSTTNYKAGFPAGTEFDFFPNGKPYQVKVYPDKHDINNNVNNNYLITACYDSLGKVLVENGNGYFKSYSDDPKDTNEEGGVKNGKRDGVWKGNSGTLKVTFTEEYINGGLVNGMATYEDGKIIPYTKTRETPPQFTGGINAFGKYLAANIRYPANARDNNIQGMVILSFVVAKDGKLGDIKVDVPVSPSLDAEAIRVIKNCPQWVPGVQFGRPVSVVYSVPINFTLIN